MQKTEATRVLIIGVNGAMGQHLAQIFTEAPDFQVAAGIDLFPSAHENAFPVYQTPTDCKEKIDLLIDFSKPGALDANLNYARSHQLPVIIATTGYSDAQKQLIAAAAKEIPVFFTANMSLGVNLQLQLCQQAAKFFGDLADIEIIEKHHNRKVDAPSGTALLLADSMNEAMGDIYHYQCARYGGDCKRKPGEIGIHSVRGGNIAAVSYTHLDVYKRQPHCRRLPSVAAYMLHRLPSVLLSVLQLTPYPPAAPAAIEYSEYTDAAYASPRSKRLSAPALPATLPR